jgi:predicted anti-sigma-YlaC factor YlaD
MRCASARRMISDGLDVAPGPDRAAELKKHLTVCPGCRDFACDLESIVGEAGKLPGYEPSGQVWQKVISGVRTSRRDEAIPTARAFRWRYALAAGSALVVIAAGLIIGLQNRRGPGVSVSDRGSAAFTMAKLTEAQSYYEKAIGALSEAVRSQQSRLTPGLAEVFERNLAGLDRTIQVCRQMVDRSPNDPMIRAYLLTAYREKVDLFENIMGFGRPPGDQTRPTTL